MDRVFTLFIFPVRVATVGVAKPLIFRVISQARVASLLWQGDCGPPSNRPLEFGTKPARGARGGIAVPPAREKNDFGDRERIDVRNTNPFIS